MGRRRKKYKKIIRRLPKIPDIFQCPHCSNRTLTIRFDKTNDINVKKAVITCGSCGLYSTMEVPSLYEEVDVYARFIDYFINGSIVVEFKKTESS
ncbi:MAG: hypothetical protein QXX35_01610 [Desulfurococcaceae archaeon]